MLVLSFYSLLKGGHFPSLKERKFLTRLKKTPSCIISIDFLESIS